MKKIIAIPNNPLMETLHFDTISQCDGFFNINCVKFIKSGMPVFLKNTAYFFNYDLEV